MSKQRLSLPMAIFGAALALGLGAGRVPAQTGNKAGVAAAVRGPVQQISFRTPSATVAGSGSRSANALIPAYVQPCQWPGCGGRLI